MGLNVETAMRVTPDSITKAGGQIIATFSATATGADTHEKTVYSIPDELPYIFANASHPTDDRIIEAPVRKVTLNPSDRRQTLVLRRTKGPAAIAMVRVDAEVFETDATGKVLEDGGGQPLPSQSSVVFINVQG